MLSCQVFLSANSSSPPNSQIPTNPSPRDQDLVDTQSTSPELQEPTSSPVSGWKWLPHRLASTLATITNGMMRLQQGHHEMKIGLGRTQRVQLHPARQGAKETSAPPPPAPLSRLTATPPFGTAPSHLKRRDRSTINRAVQIPERAFCSSRATGTSSSTLELALSLCPPTIRVPAPTSQLWAS